MKKLKLEIDALKVESFEASGVQAGPGTVQGFACTPLCNSVRICPPNDPSYDPCPVYTDRCADSNTG
ncbi:MAG TPA: hypothetical protein VLK84_11425 [Longimicrobium sp.]|nr:hypothetical protein [Longimicrobium sp.]